MRASNKTHVFFATFAPLREKSAFNFNYRPGSVLLNLAIIFSSRLDTDKLLIWPEIDKHTLRGNIMPASPLWMEQRPEKANTRS